MNLQPFQDRIAEELAKIGFDAEPRSLYEPAAYILNLGGKRLRPALTLLSCGLYTNWEKAIPQALAVEVFHNFTLMHDDIMDQAPLRRGKPTVHHQWNVNTAILSGDAMLVKAYQLLSNCEPQYLPQLMDSFNEMALGLCEGQQMDMDFEQRQDVSEDEYIRMIQLKTSILLGCALQMGAILGDASIEDQKNLYQFGLLLGTSFQIKDDLLDCFGAAEKVGKQVGGDILANKKTVLLLHALINANDQDQQELQQWLTASNPNPDEKVAAVKLIFERSGAVAHAEELMSSYFNLALDHLEAVSSTKKQPLQALAEWLYNRDY